MLPVLTRWNRWGSAQLKSGFAREIIKSILSFIDTPETITLTGMRRAGKTTILYQIMDYLLTQDVPIEAMLHMNFEEPGLGPKLGFELLDEIYRCYRTEIYPKGKAYIFFDEIQNVPEWERWVRARNESEDIKIFITGSSANLMSRELATILTGRHINFYVSPLNFKEFLFFRNIEMPKRMLSIDPHPEIENALNQYLLWGGLPEIVLSKNDLRRRMLLRQYFDDVIFKDVAMRHQIRDVVILRNIAVHLLTQTASLISVNRLAKLFNISVETAGNYCNYLQEAFIVDFTTLYSLKVAERNRNPHKVYACDLGMRQVVSLTQTPDKGRLIESLVNQHLQSMVRNDLFYWKDNQEVDFVIRKGNSIYAIIQVASDNLDDIKVMDREIGALNEANKKFPKAMPLLIAGKMPKKHQKFIIPLWKFLCQKSEDFTLS